MSRNRGLVGLPPIQIIEPQRPHLPPVPWALEDGRAKRHQINPIDSSGLSVSVADNFAAGDALILERPIGLFDGADVDASGS